MQDVTGIPLTPDLIRGHLLELMQPGRTYKREELLEKAHARHTDMGGEPPNVDNPREQFSKVLASLKRGGRLENPQPGFWRRSGSRSSIQIETVHQKKKAEQNAEVVIGDGPESIYGWYFPRDRKLAEYEQSNRYPIKVGMTKHTGEGRLNASAGEMAPEMPVLGFVAHVGDCREWERLIHAKLKLRGHWIKDAMGSEWFNTNLDELREFVSQEMVQIEQDNEKVISK